MGDPEGDAVPRAGLWKKVLGVMRLNMEQRADLLEQRRTFLNHLAEVARQRQEIINSLQVCSFYDKHLSHSCGAVRTLGLGGSLLTDQ
jgi:hypothetical protein